MATRINTKFVITLVAVLLLIVLGLMFAFMFLKKSAEDHANLAQAAMGRADVALVEGDYELQNSERQRAAKHFGNAVSKDAGNIAYLYGYIEAHEKLICDNLTAAGNQRDAIIAGAANIHDTPGASDEDRAVLYELLYDSVRMNSGASSGIGAIVNFATKRLDVAPNDPVATKYKAIATGYFAETRTKAEEIEKDIELLNAAAKANPTSALLQSALARYHLGNARRIYRSQGNTFNQAVNTSFTIAYEYAKAALKLAENDPAAYIEAAIILSEIRSNEEAVTAQIIDRQNQVAIALSDLLADKTNRDKLYVAEIASAVTLIRRVQPAPDADPPQTFDGPAKALELAKLLPKERPNQPSAFQLLGNLQREANRFEQAIETFNKGVAAKRLANAQQFVIDHESRLNMDLLLADLNCTMAARMTDSDKREASLKKISASIDKLAVVDTLNTAGRDARVAFLRGQIALMQNKPQVAVTLLETANQAYSGRDARTLRLLAQTHAQLNNDALVTGYYETIVNNNLRPTADDLINLINLYLNPGENQQLERAASLLDTYDRVVPNDMRSVRLRARALQIQGKTDEAIALLKAQDLAKHPDLLTVIASLQATTGNTQGVIDILRERLANTAEGEKMNMQLISQLLNLLPDAETKQAELVKLVDQGLDQAFADILNRVLTSGQPKLEDELKMIDLMQEDKADAALQKYLTYRRWNQEEAGRPLLDEAIALSPNKPNILEWRYKIALDEQRWNDAEQAIKEMLALPTNERPEGAIADGRFMRAQLLAAQAGAIDAGEARSKRVRDAIVAYNSALGQYSHYIEGWIQLGRLHLSQENYFAAQDSLQEALDRQSQNTTALELLAIAQVRGGDQANALENLQRVLAIEPNRASALNQFTALATQMGLTARAINLREQIGQRAPRNYDNRRALALLYAQNNAFDNAKKTIQAVIDEQGSTRQNVAVKSQVLANNNEDEQSIKTTKDYIASLGDEAAWPDYLLLAQVYEQAKQVGLADQAFNQAIALEKQGDTLTSVAAFGQAKILRGQVAQAAEMFEGLIAQYPDNDALKQQTAELYLQLRNYDKAESIAKGLPQSAGRDRLLVQSAASQPGKLGIAIERANKAVKAYPSDFGLRLNLIELLRNQQDVKAVDQRDYTRVLAQAKALAKDHSDRVEAKVALADVLLRMDRLPEATAQLEQAVSFAPRHIGANDRLFRIRLAEAGSLAASDPQASQDKARQALSIMAILIESRPNVATLLRSAGQAAELAGLQAQAIAYYRQSFEAEASAEGLATYALALLSVNQGANARAILENADNATLVSNNLFLRALRGRAIASVGQVGNATTLFSNLLKESNEPNERMIVARQIATAFRTEPTRAIELFESTLGADLPIEIEELVAGMLLLQQDYELAVKRLSKYWDKPVADVNTQITLMTQLALAQQESAQYTQAKATYEHVYELIAKNETLVSKGQRIQLLNNMAFLLADQKEGYEADAIRYAEQAVALMSETDSVRQYALIQDTLGWAYHKAGRNQDAIRVLKQSVDRLPLVANQLHLGRVYLAMEDKDRALLVLEAAVNQAKSEKDEKMIAETQKWYRQAL